MVVWAPLPDALRVDAAETRWLAAHDFEPVTVCAEAVPAAPIASAAARSVTAPARAKFFKIFPCLVETHWRVTRPEAYTPRTWCQQEPRRGIVRGTEVSGGSSGCKGGVC